MFEHRIDEMVREFEQRLRSQGMQLDLYLQYNRHGYGELP
jgi:FKBP-type peptidyl-prolyl cis-trans isomerase (trigger factor)